MNSIVVFADPKTNGHELVLLHLQRKRLHGRAIRRELREVILSILAALVATSPTKRPGGGSVVAVPCSKCCQMLQNAASGGMTASGLNYPAGGRADAFVCCCCCCLLGAAAN